MRGSMPVYQDLSQEHHGFRASSGHFFTRVSSQASFKKSLPSVSALWHRAAYLFTSSSSPSSCATSAKPASARGFSGLALMLRPLVLCYPLAAQSAMLGLRSSSFATSTILSNPQTRETQIYLKGRHHDGRQCCTTS